MVISDLLVYFFHDRQSTNRENPSTAVDFFQKQLDRGNFVQPQSKSRTAIVGPQKRSCAFLNPASVSTIQTDATTDGFDAVSSNQAFTPGVDARFVVIIETLTAALITLVTTEINARFDSADISTLSGTMIALLPQSATEDQIKLLRSFINQEIQKSHEADAVPVGFYSEKLTS